jgi:protein-tyrosine phosphatase
MDLEIGATPRGALGKDVLVDIMRPGRDLGLVGLPNGRDLGGYRTETGAIVRYGVLLRADAPIGATDEDLRALDRLGVRRVIDMRGDGEIAHFGLSAWTAPRTHLPISDVVAALLAQQVKPGAEPLPPGSAQTTMRGMYRDFVADPDSRAQFATALRTIADPDGVPLLFHCTAGKDRTGWLAALVLAALGVDRATITADYLLTNERFATGRGAAGRARLLASLGELGVDVVAVLPLLEARTDYLDAAFAEVDARYGDMPAFLRVGLDADVDALRANLLE